MTLEERIATLEERSAANRETLERIDSNVQSLMESRAYQRGLWGSLVATATVISTLVSIAVAYFAGRH